MIWPATLIHPPSMPSRWLMHRSNVLLPAPDGPRMHSTSDSRTRRSTPLRTWRLPKDFETAWHSTTSGLVATSASAMAHPHPPADHRALEQRPTPPVEAASELPLEVVLPDAQHRRRHEVPRSRHDEELHHIRVGVVDRLGRPEQLVQHDEGGERRELQHPDRLVADRREDDAQRLGEDDPPHVPGVGCAE